MPTGEATGVLGCRRWPSTLLIATATRIICRRELRLQFAEFTIRRRHCVISKELQAISHVLQRARKAERTCKAIVHPASLPLHGLVAQPAECHGQRR